MPEPAIIEERAPAKVNLTLEVLGRRPDGYHELRSLIAFADVADRVRLDVGGDPGVTVAGPFAAAIVGENLVERALALVAGRAPFLRLGRIEITKHLPVAAGLGGGSSDAAAALRALRRANPGRAAEVDWSQIALELGADVPVCLAGRAALARGRGEQLSPVPALPSLPAVLVNPVAGPPANKTAAVFAALQAEPCPRRIGAAPHIPRDREALLTFLDEAGNDLEAPARALFPGIAQAQAAVGSAGGCRLVRMSGAGPTSFALFDTASQAAFAAARISREHPAWWVAATTLGA